MQKQYGPLLLALVLAAAAAGCRCSELVDDINADLSQHNEASVYFQDVNSYLTQYFNLAAAAESGVDHVVQFKPIVRSVLRDAIQTLESGRLAPGKLSHELDRFAPLQANQKETLSIMRELLKALDSCETTSLDFLIIILEFNTFQGQTLHQFAKSRLNECWHEFIARLVRRIDASLGKMSAPLFEFFDKLLDQIGSDQARLLEESSLEKHRANRIKGQISIRENSAQKREFDDEGNPIERARPLDEILRARYSEETLERLKLVSFDSKQTLRSFGLMLNRLFNEHHGGPVKLRQKFKSRQSQVTELKSFLQSRLLEPCEQLMQRVRDSCAGAAVFKSHVNQTLGEALVGATQGDLRLDYQLSIYRICRLTLKNKATLWELLNDMR